jgi:RNA polymerase sigma-70 factor (ECF subfamily)
MGASPADSDSASDDLWSSMMRAAMAGDEAVYRRLLEALGRSVRAMARAAFARARLGDADVEDAVQETLLAIHLKRHTWDPTQKLGPWVNAVARHKIIDAMRRRGARRAEPIEDFEEFLAAPEAEDPHALTDAKRLMETLNPRQRDIVQSISLDGQSIASVASRLSMSEVAVRVALHRALKALGAAWRRSVS